MPYTLNPATQACRACYRVRPRPAAENRTPVPPSRRRRNAKAFYRGDDCVVALWRSAGCRLAANIYTVDIATTSRRQGHEEQAASGQARTSTSQVERRRSDPASDGRSSSTRSRPRASSPSRRCSRPARSRRRTATARRPGVQEGEGRAAASCATTSGPAIDRTAKIFCNLKLTLYNISGAGKNGGMAIRLDGDPARPLGPGRQDDRLPDRVHTAHQGDVLPIKIERPAGARAALHGAGPAPASRARRRTNTVIEVRSIVNKSAPEARSTARWSGSATTRRSAARPASTVESTFVDDEGRAFTARKRSARTLLAT